MGFFFTLGLVLGAAEVAGTTAGYGNDEPVIGYGYVVKSAELISCSGSDGGAGGGGAGGGGSVTALLELIRTSSVFGPDVQLLSLNARYISPVRQSPQSFFFSFFAGNQALYRGQSFFFFFFLEFPIFYFRSQLLLIL